MRYALSVLLGFANSLTSWAEDEGYISLQIPAATDVRDILVWYQVPNAG